MGMGAVNVADLMSGALWTMLTVVLPVLLVAMAVGLIIGILQTATSIQEQTLVFVPKIVAVFIFLIIAGPWMGERILALTMEILGQLERFIQ